MSEKNDDISKPNTEGPKKIDSDWKAKVKMEKEKSAAMAKEKAAAKFQKPLQAGMPASKPESETPEKPVPAENVPGPEKDEQAGEPVQPEEAPESLSASEANFMNFISSMAAQVMISLGQEPHPLTHRMELNLEQASYTIDILGMLKDKTKGNLTKQEERYFNQLLYQLQLVYTQIVKQLEQRNKSGNRQV